MPILSAFYGIIVQMFYEKSGRHHVPHIHVEYGENTAVLDLQGNLLAGSLPTNKMNILLGWMEIHKEELELNWKLILRNHPPMKIRPLR